MDSVTRAGARIDVHDHPPDASAPGGGSAPVVVLLHGFPQDASAYAAVVPLLTAAGARVLLPDQRGYSPGARPPGLRAYAVHELVADVAAVLDAADVARAHVVGHDWGGVVAWAFAHQHPERTGSLTVLSTPHPAAVRRGVRRGSQALRSAYVLAFQVPWLPERLLLARRGALLRRALVRTGLAPEAADRYVARMRAPGALTAALAWYRALRLPHRGGTGPVAVPTTYLSARRDPFFSGTSVAGTAAHVTGAFTRVDLDADHWLPEHRPGDVAAAVLARLR
jgi:pimeloyl-ACP methyl ester carboxylesterase